mmetsp:Transcript_91714/g.243698  ORF Transcript_91714/g.243698 Transcript_91714/m.243698 type:complete len:249 (+) Transcript_91714:372-1118(+)
MAQVGDDGRDVPRVEPLVEVLPRDHGSEARGGHGGHHVDLDVAAQPLTGQRAGQADHTSLASAIARHSGDTEEARDGGRDHHAAVPCTPEVRPSRSKHRVGAVQVHCNLAVPLLVGVLVEAAATSDPRVADHHVDPAPSVQGRLHDAGPVLHRRVARHGFAPCGPDLVDHLVRRPGAPAAHAIGGAAEVVDDNGAASRGELQSVGAAEAPPRTRDHGHSARELHHALFQRVQASAPGALAAADGTKMA